MSPRESSITVTVKSNDVCSLLFSQTYGEYEQPALNTFSLTLTYVTWVFYFSSLLFPVYQFSISFSVPLLLILLPISVDYPNQTPVPSRETRNCVYGFIYLFIYLILK